ncbi:SsgA family sporulation/cell division regulator [Kitasatospora albolonga]|uniref:SsgA family sporulation/cell division regulator n=1 Tax=Kitasatospora albolonga TaxID=68173 RepID=UPI0031ECD9A3
MTTSRSTLHCLAVRILNGPHPDLVLACRLAFDTALPYGVHLGISGARPFADGEPPVCWTFGRDLLDQGLRRPAGQGDVLVAPGPGGTVLVELRGPAGSAVLGLSAEQVGAFLDDAYALVPQGAEGEHLDVDECLTRLLVRPEQA